MSETLQHLVLVRHGEGEGDVRRAAWRRGEEVQATKKPEAEEITSRGAEQGRRAGLWIVRHVLTQYTLPGFDGCYVSSAIRSEQTAVALGLDVAVWQEDHRLDERNRGHVRGLRPQEHRQRFPDSFAAMKDNPLHWAPPGGESILEVADKARLFLRDIEGAHNVLAVTHRDWMWAAMMPLENLGEDELVRVNTDEIHNAQILHYTSINPETGETAPTLMWKRSIDPMQPENSAGWQPLSHAMARADGEQAA